MHKVKKLDHGLLIKRVLGRVQVSIIDQLNNQDCFSNLLQVLRSESSWCKVRIKTFNQKMQLVYFFVTLYSDPNEFFWVY
jgi:hypothetical protein